MRILTKQEKTELFMKAKKLIESVSLFRLDLESNSDDKDENLYLDLEEDSLDSSVRHICKELLKAAKVKDDCGCPLCRS